MESLAISPAIGERQMICILERKKPGAGTKTMREDEGAVPKSGAPRGGAQPISIDGSRRAATHPPAKAGQPSGDAA